MSRGVWEFWIDRGGTFTDVVARTPDGELRTEKLLSVNPGHYPDATVEGVRRLLAAAPPERRAIGSVRMGTTVGTNALLERRGATVAIVITAGFGDAIRIGGQQRPDIFALAIELPEMLYVRTIEARERLAADGRVLVPLDAAKLERDLAAAREAGVESVAIVLMHGYLNPAHERLAAQLAARAGFADVSVSHEVSPLQKLVTRGDTTLVDAYLSPVLRRYVASVREGLAQYLHDAPLLCMQSHGGLIDAARFRGKDCLLSGPAGGVIGMIAAARGAGLPRVIGFDMGGTSTDVSLFDGELTRSGETTIAGVRISAPMLEIHTVAAGGGSILAFANGRLQVGPESAGAHPGPASYRNDGPLTITDANVYLGRIDPGFFPHVFGPRADEPLDAAAVTREFGALARRVAESTGEAIEPERLAAGFLRIAVERMANAIKRISIQRGHDTTAFALCAFGGAGGQHACAVAEALGIRAVLIHPLAGVLSAYGMGVAALRAVRRASVEAKLTDTLLATLAGRATEIEDDARDALAEQADAGREPRIERRLLLKIAGADTALRVPWDPRTAAGPLAAAFAAEHARHFGFGAAADAVLIVESLEIEAVAVRGEADIPDSATTDSPTAGVATSGGATAPDAAAPDATARDAAPDATARDDARSGSAVPTDPLPVGRRRMWAGGGWADVPVYERAALAAGTLIAGPALIVEHNATTVVEPDWRATVDRGACLVLTRATAPASTERVSAAADPVMLEIFNNLFMHVAEEMGTVLASTAHSVNIKERLDFSCALFDGDGALIANAPHIPVHLGSMGDSVRSIVRERRAELAPGSAFVLNTPYNGGTHLPDVTVVTPVFTEGPRAPSFFVASRAHHADIGGVTPGSMPPGSRTIAEEGVLLNGERIVEDFGFLEARVRALFAAGPHPARNVDQNVADLRAQLAANARGAAELARIVERYGTPVVRAYMRHVQDNAEACVREAIGQLADGRFTVELDGGERIAVSVAVDARERAATIDFAGSSAQSLTNFNAPAAIVRAVVLYVFRTLVRQSIPLNAGCLRPLTIRVPEPSLLAPAYPAAVVAGNVETSQCIADAVLAALGVCAASQGTMNNFTFGDARHQYYETICGGAGAGPTFNGASAVHTHMTNSRLTDPEVLESRFPVRLVRFAIRRGSGGAGRHTGGDGVIRDIEFLAPMHAAILSNRRRIAPFGLHGGAAGEPGRNYLIRRTGTVEMLSATAQVELAPGDRFVIETPGGGGYGS